jgi:predicted ester cyclase
MRSTDDTGRLLYMRFVDAVNSGDDAGLAAVMADDFVDHHPGFAVGDLESYRRALRSVRAALDLRIDVESLTVAGDRVFVIATCTGRHVGTFMGRPPTGRQLRWQTIEVWRIAGGKFVERWIQDDAAGLREQLSSDTVNVAAIRRLNDVVNSRRYDGMDELFAPAFVDHNPAWSVADLDELKAILASAHRALDMHAVQDEVYAADGDRVVIHLTFHGTHVGEFLGAAPSGRAVTWTSIEVYRLTNGRIVERWVQADTTGLMRQLGLAALPQG